jgi:hypothetical protein
MVSILPPKRNMFSGIAEALSQFGSRFPELYKQQNIQEQQKQQEALRQQQQKSIQEKLGPEIAGLPPELQKVFAQDLLKGQRQQQEFDMIKNLYGDSRNQQSQQNQEPQQTQTPQQQFDPSQISDQQIAQISTINPNLAKIIQQQKDSAISQKRAEEKIDYQSFKDNKDYVEKVLGGFEGYKRDKMILDQMENISSSGNLPKPISVAFLNKLGIPIGVLENPGAEQFEKLSQELMKNIQGTYGSRILQSEVQSFMKSIPSLLNSEEGQKKLIKQWKLLNEGKRIYYDAYREIKKENPKRLPPDLHEKVLDKSEDKLDKLADQFKSINESENVNIKSPDGKIRIVPRSMLQQAIESGGELIK